MPSFDIVRKCDVRSTFRTEKVKADFDVSTDNATEHFKGSLDLPDDWQVGLIAGGSGTGKTTLATELFGDFMYHPGIGYSGDAAVIDEMPKASSVEEIERMFYAVGFGSVPCWLKPYSVLSNGEKMRVDLARALLMSDFVVFDEYTSVVDRQVAKVMSIALRKCLKRYPDKRFVAVTCHTDVEEFLNPDWTYSTDTFESFFADARSDRHESSKSGAAGMRNGSALPSIII